MDAFGPWAKLAQLRFRVDFVTLCERFICDARILDRLDRIRALPDISARCFRRAWPLRPAKRYSDLA
jgi:hypothetical protein